MQKILCYLFTFGLTTTAFTQKYPQGYFRHPLNIPMQLVANFGEIRTNHWHMGLDIRTQQRENLPVYASAEGYIARVVVEPGGFGQAIYINHPNGYTTLYAHMNSFFTELNQYVKEQQYARESWKVDLRLEPSRFPVNKGQLIGLSGNTGGSAGPHVHFEIRDTKTENVLNPLLFRFPIPDKVPPAVTRLAMYDRNKSTYAQVPQMLNIKSTKGRTVRVGSNRISFAVGAVDRFSGTPNPNGIYAAKVIVDGKPVSSFVLDDISYDDTRYMNAQIDFSLSARGGAVVQHITPLPGAMDIAYNISNKDGVIELTDTQPHAVIIEVQDANFNTTSIPFSIQFDPSLKIVPLAGAPDKLLPNNVNIFERPDFELYSSDRTIYDTVDVTYSTSTANAGAVSLQHNFINHTIPAHDAFTVRIRPTISLNASQKNGVIIKNVSGARTYVQKAEWQNGWLSAKFRQFGSFQAFVDDQPPTINSVPADLSKVSRIVFSPRDNFNSIKSFRAELDGKWLRFTNDKGKNWIYNFDEKFPRGEHRLMVRVEDEAGNVTEREWLVKR